MICPGCRDCFIADNLKTVTKLSKSGPAFHYHFNPHAPVEECQLKNVPPVSNISLVSFLSNLPKQNEEVHFSNVFKLQISTF